MDNNTPTWHHRWLIFEERLAQAGLGDVAHTLKEAFTPLAPLVAQCLWLTQPVFGLFGQYQDAGEMAEFLYDPAQHRPGD